MPFDSQGKFTRMHNWEQDRIDDIDIVTDHHDQEDDNFADAFNECFLRNGSVPMKSNLDVGNFRVINTANAINDKDVVNKGQLNNLQESLITNINNNMMIGDIKCSALQSDHNNWVLCDGRALSRENYQELFEAIGTAFGGGNGSSTFNIPDCRGVAIRGVDNGRGLDSNRKLGSYQADQIQNHTHGLPGTESYCAGGGRTLYLYGASDMSPADNYRTSNDLKTGRGGSETRMKNIALNYFIKVKGE